MPWSSGLASPAPHRFTVWRSAGCASSASSSSCPDMTAGRRTAKRGSSGSATSNIHPTCRCCAKPIALWRDLETESGKQASDDHRHCRNRPARWRTRARHARSSKLHGLPHEVLDASALRERFPAFAVPASYVGVYQPDGGFLVAEPAVSRQIDRAVDARRRGANPHDGADYRAARDRRAHPHIGGDHRARIASSSLPVPGSRH